MTDLELINKYVPDNLRETAIDKLNTGYPVQYIIGNVIFYGLQININENVLIPRFESEYLVDKTIKYLKKLNIYNPNVLEIGTGSGCLSIAIKKNIKCNIKAIDISESALEVAKDNALLNKVDIDFVCCDINNYNDKKKYDLIISNPPYVPYNSNYSEKIKYEPEIAIFAQDNGIYFYKVILDKICNNLTDKYLIAFEIGDKEGDLIKEVVKEKLPTANVLIEKDYNGYERYMFISSKVIEI